MKEATEVKSKANKGKKRSEETRNKIAESKKGKHWKIIGGKEFGTNYQEVKRRIKNDTIIQK